MLYIKDSYTTGVESDWWSSSPATSVGGSEAWKQQEDGRKYALVQQS